MKFKVSHKFIAGFFIIFSLAFILINFYLGQQIEKANLAFIQEDLIKDRENLNIYIRQAFLIKNITMSEERLSFYGRELMEEIKSASSDELALFSIDGNLIYTSNTEMFSNKSRQDFLNAQNGKSSFTIKRDYSTRVYFSYPLITNGIKLGIISTAKDYTALYTRMDKLLRYILIITAIVFIVIFVFSILLSRSISVPILRLSKASSDIAAGNFTSKVQIITRDEIGELTINFYKMVDTLKKQIETIRNDKDKLEELSNHRKKFFDNVTHELKTPLTTILGYGEVLKDNGFNDEDFFHKAIKHIIDESKRLHSLVINLLELSKEENVESKYDFGEVDLTELVRSTCEEMNFKAKRYNTEIKCEIEEALVSLGNCERLKEVFINLLDNSIKYGRSGNIITVEGRSENSSEYITITDKGIGMSKKQLEMIFEPFYRGNKKKSRELGSCGLGLSIVQAILESHKAEINFYSELNRGTKAVLRFSSAKSLHD